MVDLTSLTEILFNVFAAFGEVLALSTSFLGILPREVSSLEGVEVLRLAL
jgi:hypothetical protein